MKLISRLLSVFTLLAGVGAMTNGVYAQTDSATKINIAEVVVIHSKILNEDRRLYIYTPATVPNFSTPTGPYPVMYMFDGEFQIQMVAGLVDYLSKVQRELPPMIVVGIDNNHYDREHDLTPTHSDKADPVSKPDTSPTSVTRTSGGGENFLRFIHEEVMPYVEQHYSTTPFKVLSGHSLGGLLSTYTLVSHPDMFNAYIAISPSVWWDDAALFKEAEAKTVANAYKNKYLFLSISSEGGEFYKDIQDINSLFQTRANLSGLSYRYAYYPEENHGSGPAKAEYDALKFVFAGYLPSPKDSTPALIEQFNERFRSHFGYSAPPLDENTLLVFAYNELEDPNKVGEAIELFKMAVKYYPASSNAFDSLGDGYAKSGNKLLAIDAYRHAIELHSSDYTEVSKSKLDALVSTKK